MNKKILQILLSVGLVFVIAGCAKNESINKQSVKKQVENFTSMKKNGKITVINTGSNTQKRPLWVSNPNMNGFKGVVSIVSTKKIKNKKKLYYIAKMKARAAFETRKGTNIDSSSQTKTDTSGKMSYAEKVKISSSHIQTDSLIVKDTFEDNNSFYMWMVQSK